MTRAPLVAPTVVLVADSARRLPYRLVMPAMKSLRMWSHGARTCTFVYGGYEEPVLCLIENGVLVREETTAPGAAVRLSELWEIEIPIPHEAARQSALVPRVKIGPEALRASLGRDAPTGTLR